MEFRTLTSSSAPDHECEPSLLSTDGDAPKSMATGRSVSDDGGVRSPLSGDVAVSDGSAMLGMNSPDDRASKSVPLKSPRISADGIGKLKLKPLAGSAADLTPFVGALGTIPAAVICRI